MALGNQPTLGSKVWLKNLDKNQRDRFASWVNARSKGMIMPQGPSTAERLSWAGRERSARMGLADMLANAEYRRNMVEGDYGSRLEGLQRQYGDVRESAPYNAVGRGLLRSGIYRHRLGELESERVRGLSDLLLQRQNALGSIELDLQAADRAKRAALEQIAFERLARRNEYAAGLR